MSNPDDEDIKIEEITSPSQNDLKDDLKLKLVLLGDSGVGKTNLIAQYMTNTFHHNSKATIGVEFFTRTYKVNDKIIRLEIWDTAGEERYKSITSVYYKGAKGAFIVYDITSRKSFNNVNKWIQEIKEKTSKDIKLMVIGNKIDLNNEREINFEEAKHRFKMDIPLIETSALNDTNVAQAFINMIKIIYQDYIYKGYDEDSLTDDKRHGKGINLKDIDKNGSHENKNRLMCCYWG